MTVLHGGVTPTNSIATVNLDLYTKEGVESLRILLYNVINVHLSQWSMVEIQHNQWSKPQKSAWSMVELQKKLVKVLIWKWHPLCYSINTWTRGISKKREPMTFLYSLAFLMSPLPMVMKFMWSLSSVARDRQGEGSLVSLSPVVKGPDPWALRGSLRFLPSTSHQRQQWRPRM